MKTDRIHTYCASRNRFAVLSSGGPHDLGGLAFLMLDGETPEQALRRHQQDLRGQIAHRQSYVDRIERALAGAEGQTE